MRLAKMCRRHALKDARRPAFRRNIEPRGKQHSQFFALVRPVGTA
jgi:hypothetical protein